MQCTSLALLILGCLAICSYAEQQKDQEEHQLQLQQDNQDENLSTSHVRAKRTLFLKKKILGAGLLGFGLGAVKGYKLGYHSGPEVHHVYLAPPPAPVKYVEYIEKPVYVPKIIEKPVFKPAHHDYEPAWSHPEPPSPVYGSW